MICDECGNSGMVQQCNFCDFTDERCSNCDGTGYVECPYLEKGWHK